jgi:hypothetical protein
MAREPYRSKMLALLANAKPGVVFEWMVEEAGSSHSDVVAKDNLEAIYKRVHGLDDTWELVYPEFYVTFRPDTYGRIPSVWDVVRTNSMHQASVGQTIQSFPGTAEGEKDARSLAYKLNGSHNYVWARRKGPSQ